LTRSGRFSVRFVLVQLWRCPNDLVMLGCPGAPRC
jgi:hypothetical protein